MDRLSSPNEILATAALIVRSRDQLAKARSLGSCFCIKQILYYGQLFMRESMKTKITKTVQGMA